MTVRHRTSPWMLLVLLAASLLAGCTTTSASNRQSLYLACRNGERLLVYEIDQATGKLNETQRVELSGPGGPIALANDGQTLYAALKKPSRIQPFDRDITTGKLTALKATEVRHFPTYLDIDATGKFAISANYSAGIVTTYPVDLHRLIGKQIQETKTDKTAHACLIDPSNRFVYIPHTTPNAIYQFRFDKGYLRPIQPLLVKGGGKPSQPAGPRHYAYHPKLPFVYVVNELNHSVGAYAWNRKTGQVARFQELPTLPAGFDQHNTCADIHVTPNGRFLYATNRGHDSIAAYKIDDDGQMHFIDWFKTEAVPREFAIDLSGRYLYCAGLKADKLAAYSIDGKTGRLTRIGTYETPAGPIWVEAVKLGE